MIFGAVESKDISGILDELRGLNQRIIFCKVGTTRGLPTSELIKSLPNEEQSDNSQLAQFTNEAPIQKKEALVESRDENAVEEQNAKQKPKAQPIRVEPKIGRNDPCPCGSGKKYKNCHGTGM